MRPTQDVHSAGVVVLRRGRRVLLVHRPKYDDWSFPKGKLEPGEHVVAAAVREVAEETGLHVRLGPRLADQHYRITRGAGRSRMKTVSYWAGRVVGDDDVSGYRPNDEIDQVEWVHLDQATDRLTYPYDRDTLEAALGVRRKTHAVVVLRHGQARARKSWRREDLERPLLKAGEQQAEGLVSLLAAYDVARVISSPARRCVQTVEPFAWLADLEVETDRKLAEQQHSPAKVARAVRGLLDQHRDLPETAERTAQRGVVVCTHRPVLPEVFEALGVDDPGLAPGEMLVAHARKGQVVAVERHHPDHRP